MDAAPEPDNVDGAEVNDVFADKTFWGLRDGTWGHQTGEYILPCTADLDRDGTPDCYDLCAYDPNKIAPGVQGCGTSECTSDRYSDGTPDCYDLCAYDPNKIDPGMCGCNYMGQEEDIDCDGVANDEDQCPTAGGLLCTGPNFTGMCVGDSCTDSGGDCFRITWLSVDENGCWDRGGSGVRVTACNVLCRDLY
jgi:hypothetical protein